MTLKEKIRFTFMIITLIMSGFLYFYTIKLALIDWRPFLEWAGVLALAIALSNDIRLDVIETKERLDRVRGAAR